MFKNRCLAFRFKDGSYMKSVEENLLEEERRRRNGLENC